MDEENTKVKRGKNGRVNTGQDRFKKNNYHH